MEAQATQGAPTPPVEGGVQRLRATDPAALAVAGVALLSVVLAVVQWAKGIAGLAVAFDHPSGSLAALGWDLTSGELYRPLLSPEGFGGTRYFPGYVLLHAALLRCGLDPSTASAALTGASALALAAGTYFLTRRLGAARLLALAAAGLALGTVPASWALVIGRADLLAAALAVWGLALCAGSPGRWQRPGAALLFALAVLTKPSAAFAPLGAAAALVLTRERGAALRLLATTAGLAGLGLAVTQAASGGRWLESLRATGAGGAELGTILLEGPVNLLANAAPISVFLFALALAVIATTLARRPPFLLPALLLSAATAVVLFGSPGVAENHLLDACVLSIAVVVAAGGAGPARPLALALLALIGLLDLAYAGMRFGPLDMRPALGTVAKVVGPPERGPLLAENPWVPLSLGERPVLLDAFTERIAAEADPRIGADLLERLDRRAFRAVVLMRPLESAAPSMGPFYEGVHFSQGFRAHLRGRYWLAASHAVNARGFGVYVWLPID